MLTAPYLHLFAQGFEHDDGAIVGNREALLALKAGIECALTATRGVACVEAFVNDGEGYFLNLYCVSDSEMERMIQPYRDRDIDDESGMWPEQLPFQPHPRVDQGNQTDAGT